MRTIKFKGKRIDNSEWVEGFYGVKGLDTDIEQHCIIVSNLNTGGTTNYFYFEDIEVDPETVSQFTGLKDKNGKEIYEGDMIQVDLKDSYTRYKVDFHEGEYILIRISEPLLKWGRLRRMFDPDMTKDFPCVNIGSIHDNKDLIK